MCEKKTPEMNKANKLQNSAFLIAALTAEMIFLHDKSDFLYLFLQKW